MGKCMDVVATSLYVVHLLFSVNTGDRHRIAQQNFEINIKSAVSKKHLLHHYIINVRYIHSIRENCLRAASIVWY